MRSVPILDVTIHGIPLPELRALFVAWLREQGKSRIIVTPNPEFLLQTVEDPLFRELLNRADLALPDGVGLQYAAAALTGIRLEHRHTGVDALEELAALCAKEGKSLLLFGGQPKTAQLTADAFRKRYPTLDVRSHDPDFIDWTPTNLRVPKQAIEAVRLHAPDVLAVGLGQGKQERFLFEYLERWPSVRIGIGVGGAFEMLSGVLPRAPQPFRRAGLEWLWRVGQQPQRIGRIARAVIVFPFIVVLATLRKHRFLKACLAVSRLLLTARG